MKEMLPTRKNPRLPRYDYAQAGYYFVTICTQDRKQTLGEVVGAATGRPYIGHDREPAKRGGIKKSGATTLAEIVLRACHSQ